MHLLEAHDRIQIKQPLRETPAQQSLALIPRGKSGSVPRDNAEAIIAEGEQGIKPTALQHVWGQLQ